MTNVCRSGLDLVGPAVGHEVRLGDVSRSFQTYFLYLCDATLVSHTSAV